MKMRQETSSSVIACAQTFVYIKSNGINVHRPSHDEISQMDLNYLSLVQPRL